MGQADPSLGAGQDTGSLARDGHLMALLSQTCFPLKFQGSPASAPVTVLKDFCPPRKETEVEDRARGSQMERDGDLVSGPCKAQARCFPALWPGSRGFFPEPQCPFYVGDNGIGTFQGQKELTGVNCKPLCQCEGVCPP